MQYGSGHALVVMVLDSRDVGSIPTLGMVRFSSVRNLIYPDWPQLQMSTNIVGKEPAMD